MKNIETSKNTKNENDANANSNSQTSLSNTGKDKRWELLNEVKKGLVELNSETLGNYPEIQSLIQNTDKFKEMKEKIAKQEENLKLELLISSRERNVYLEKLRKIEEFCEDKNWEDPDGLLKEIYDILYVDN
jgi:hypothetical protein